MKILVITPGYPHKYSSDYPFVEQLVIEFAHQGNDVTVVSPFSITKQKHICSFKTVKHIGSNTITILRPNYLSFSKLKIYGVELSSYLGDKAISRALKTINIKPDAVYAHFWESGFRGFDYAKRNNIPLFVATGESNIKNLFSCNPSLKDFYDYVKGVICVSTKNKEESISLGLTTEDRCGIFPNAIDNSLFKKLDKSTVRKQLALPVDAFIVVSVGSFKESKGPLRLAEALNRIQDKPTYSIFVGKGPQNPQCPNIIFKGAIPHDNVPLYLNAADVFVLPTLAEGCCNAVIEAMACGLPIISSNLPFNWDVLNEANSIMIDPDNIDQIANAIKELRDHPLKRESMSRAALKTAENLTLNKRATKILKFIKSKINKNND